MRRKESLYLFIIVIVALALRLYLSTRPPYWFDECLSAAIAQLSFKDIIGFSLQSHPPFYAILLLISSIQQIQCLALLPKHHHMASQ